MNLKQLETLSINLKTGTKAVSFDIVELGCALAKLIEVAKAADEYVMGRTMFKDRLGMALSKLEDSEDD